MTTTTTRPMTVTQVTEVCWHVTSERNPDADPYIVRLVGDHLSCDCPAALYRAGECKHERLVAETILAAKQAAAEARLAEARRVMTNRLLGRPDDYGTA